MPAKVVQHQTTLNGSNMATERYNSQLRAPEALGIEDSSSGDGRARKRLQKSTLAVAEITQGPGENASATPELRPHLAGRRRPSIRDQKAPLGARPLEASPSKNPPKSNSAVSYRSASSGMRQPPHSRQTSANNISAFNFGARSLEQKKEVVGRTDPYPFLPTVNFDDFHTSITSGGPLSGNIHGLESSFMSAKESVSSSGEGVTKVLESGMPRRSTLANSELRVARSGSLSQRQNITARPKLSPASSTSKVETIGPPSVALPAKARRQSHFPTSASSTTYIRLPRKSIGPGIVQNTWSDKNLATGQPSLRVQSNESEGQLMERSVRARASKDAISISREDQFSFSSARNSKAKSLHVPASLSQEYISAASMTPENPWATPLSTARSPITSKDRGTTTPSSGRRLSVMPGHATGLGARTISPTDARRLKRMSMMPNMPALPHTPPMSLPDLIHMAPQSASDLPSLIPRKSITPSSSRTTPDPNRKSYCSVVSNSSNTSYSSGRALTSASRLPPSSSLSRLPTLKSRSDNTTNGAEEEVPPVPAIPKAYESPKNELDIPFFAPRKSSLTDANSLDSTSTADRVSTNSSEKDQPVYHREIRERRGLTTEDAHKIEDQSSRGTLNNIRNLQPLRLPPLNLLPLSTPTADKIAALHDRSSEPHWANATPPPKRGQMKTPSTPMTASKASFFSRQQYKDDPAPMPNHARSSSSHYALRSESSSYRAASSSSSSVQGAVDTQPRFKAVSPFVSSLLPKNSGEFDSIRPKASGDRSISNTGFDHKPSRLTGPREQTSIKTAKADTRSQPTSPMEPEIHSFGTTIRRKLSMSRKRSPSKTEITGEGETDIPPQPPKHDAMPPPRLPASATWTGPWLANPSPTQKPQYLSSRRKTSNSDVVVKSARSANQNITTGTTDKITTPSSEYNTHKVPSRSAAAGSMDAKPKPRAIDTQLDRDDLAAEEEMKRLALRRKDTEIAARELDELRRRAVPKERVSPAQALRTAQLNIFERGEIIDFKEVYFCGTRTARKFTGDLEAESANFGYDDERGDYNIVTGDHLAYRYEVVDILGKGSFGQVVRCVDHKTGGLVAIKIIRNKKRFHQQALVEVNILQKLRDWDPQNMFSMVSFTQSFYFRGHLCISTELLGMNLYEFIKIHDFKGFSVKLIRRFTKQLLNSLVLLKSHKVIHCDLKPENILLAHPAHSEIKVIDFGSSCLENEKVYTYIQSRFYRSPEVILGMTYGMPIDMWSLGCILAELLTGYPIFPGENEQEQLACIMEVFGPPDKHLIEKSTRKKLFFDSLGKPRLTISSKGKRRRPSSKTLQQTLRCDDEAFLDFITRCLRWDPDRRMKPDDAINHEFITGIRSTSRNIRSLQSSGINSTSSSPVKRYNSIHTPASTVRPLPDTPATSLRSGPPVRNQERQNSGSPGKAAPKRQSTMTGLHTGAANKRVPMVSSVSSSALPRVGGPRLVSGKPDMASAAAAIATTKMR